MTYARGSSGGTVRQIQQLLLDWGYYSGEVDGIFGSETEDAVEYFQSKNGLTVDGKVGPATMEALGIAEGGESEASGTTDNELALLARLISAEARGEPYAGQVAVGAVVLNRVEHPSFPNTISEVIFQPGAFSCMLDGQWDEPVADSAYQAARDALAAGLTPDAVLTEAEDALAALAELTGRSVHDDVTDRIFSRFCVGK